MANKLDDLVFNVMNKLTKSVDSFKSEMEFADSNIKKFQEDIKMQVQKKTNKALKKND